MSGPGAKFHFLPWVRQGAVRGITQQDTLGTGLPGRAPMPLKLRLNAVAADDVNVPLRLLGPADVVGLQPREIIRTEPPHLTPDFPPHLFAAIEFDRPDFPWLFTPAAARADNGRLRPWLVVVVVRRALARFTVDPRRPLPMLECPSTELPDLTDSWAWAHAQFTGNLDGGQTLEAALEARPQQTVSRLLCPRRLQARQSGVDSGYVACLVPAFEAGRKAGLGEALAPEDTTALAPAWTLPAPGGAARPVLLPVYHQWEFGTGEDEDFEELVDRLTVLRELPGVKPRLMDVSRPGDGLPEFPGATLGVESALMPAAVTRPGWPTGLTTTFEGFKQQLQSRLEATAPPPPGAGPVPPPIYGRGHAGTAATQATPLAPGAAPPWLRDLNLDPRYRVAAALGVQVVQKQQEQLVTAAWEQAEQLETVNQWLRQKQLAREVTLSVYEKRLKALSPTSLVQLTAPSGVSGTTAATSTTSTSFAKTSLSATGTSLSTSVPLPTAAPAPAQLLRDALSTTTFRRIARPLGPVMGRALRSAVVATPDAPAPSPTLAMETLERASLGTFKVAPPPGVSESIAGSSTLETESMSSTSLVAGTDPVIQKSTLSATSTTLGTTSTTLGTTSPTLDKSVLLGKLEPQAAFTLEAEERVEVPAGEVTVSSRPDPLAPMAFTPQFSQPMYEALRDLFPEALVPGLDRVPHNSISLFETNPRFIEAYMAGLNHELSRELLWREFPTPLKTTFFRQFWDVRGRLPPNATPQQQEALKDIPAVESWQAGLGGNMPQGRGSGLLVLMVKGDLLERHPNALIYAARAKWSKDASGRDVAPAIVDEALAPELPVLRVNPGHGVMLLGFNLTRPVATGVAAPPGDPGYYFVLQEHPTEPRFGLDLSGPTTLTTWRELSWPRVPTRQDGSGYITLGGTAPVLTVTETPLEQRTPDADRTVRWGFNGAHMAFIALQKPYRFEVHARFWLDPAVAR